MNDVSAWGRPGNEERARTLAYKRGPSVVRGLQQAHIQHPSFKTQVVFCFVLSFKCDCFIAIHQVFIQPLIRMCH